MTWTRALTYVGIWVLLSTYYLAVPRTAEILPDASEDRAAVAAGFVALQPADVRMLDVQAQGMHLRAQRSNDRWQVVEPSGAAVPSDLLDAVVSVLTEVPTVEVVEPGAADGPGAEFGLDRSPTRVTLDDGETPVTVVLGSRNPPQTAIYARREGESNIVLLGLNVQYYVDLAIESLRRSSTK